MVCLGAGVDAAVCIWISGPLYTFASVTCLFPFGCCFWCGLDAVLLLFILPLDLTCAPLGVEVG